MTAPDKPGLSNEELKPEVQAALSGGGDERWVLDELKKWIKSLDKKYLDGLYYPRLYGAILEKLSDLESQASGKVKTNAADAAKKEGGK